jgi:hypothetical protein
MREQYTGRFEGLSPFHAYIVDHINELAAETSGDVEAPTGWFAYVEGAGRSWLVMTDDRGFWYVFEESAYGAMLAFNGLDSEYGDWQLDNDDAFATGEHVDN